MEQFVDTGIAGCGAAIYARARDVFLLGVYRWSRLRARFFLRQSVAKRRRRNHQSRILNVAVLHLDNHSQASSQKHGQHRQGRSFLPGPKEG